MDAGACLHTIDVLSDEALAQARARLNPAAGAMLRALQRVVEKASGTNCELTVCGEIGGRPLEAMALIGLGFRSLSMAPTSIGPVKAMLLALDAGRVSTLIREELDRDGGGDSLRPALIRFAKQNGIPV